MGNRGRSIRSAWVLVAMLTGCSGGDDDDAKASGGTGGAPTSGGAGQASGSGGQGTSSGGGGSSQTGSSTGDSHAGSGTGGSSAPGTGGSGGMGTPGTGGTDSGTGGASTGSGGIAAGGDLENFSFFMISQPALTKLASDMGKPDGFGGDLTYGETGDGPGCAAPTRSARRSPSKACPARRPSSGARS